MHRSRPLLLLVPLLLAGCASSPSSIPPASTSASVAPSNTPPAVPDACQLMTIPEVLAISGAAMVNEGNRAQGDEGQCEFLGGTASLMVELEQSDDPATLIADYDSLKTQLSSPPSTFQITLLPNFEGGAFIAHQEINDATAAGIYVLDGRSFFAVICQETPQCSAQQLMSGATFASSKLP